MMMTSSNSPNAPYLRHAREHQKANEGWTVTLKIAIPKPRHWLACSTGWIVIFIVYLSSTLWVSGFNKNPYLSSNSSSFSKYLQGSVTTFLPIRAVHDTEEVYEEMLEPGTGSEPKDPFLSNAAMSTWSPVVPSKSSDSIPLSESRENIEAMGVTLPGSDPSNMKDGEVEPGRYPAPTIVPEELVERDRYSSSLAPSNVTDAAPAPSTEYPRAGDHQPADSADVVDFEATDPTLANGSSIGTAFAPDGSSKELDEKILPAGNRQGEKFGLQGSTDPAESVDTSDSSEVSRVGAPASSPAEEEPRVEQKEASAEGPAGSPQPSEPENSSTSSWTEVAPKAVLEDGESHSTPTESSNLQQQEENSTDAANLKVTSSAPAPASLRNYLPSEETKVETPPFVVSTSEGEPEPVIRATSIRGRKAVEAFRNYFDCVSESGKWVYDPTPRILPWSYVSERYLNMCDGYHEMVGGVYGEEADRIALSGVGKWAVREALKWVWQSNDTCPLQRVTRDELCRRLGPKRNIMVVGDSLNHGLSWSIMNHLITNGTGYERFMNYDRSTDGVYEMCGDVFGQGNGFKISFVRNDRLSLISEPVYDDRSNFHEYPWMDLVRTYGVKILLLNRGAHYENDTVYEKALRETFSALRKRHPDVQVIYRNTPPGHANCTNMTAVPPLAERQEFGWDGVKWPDFYSWGLFAKQNVLARKIVEEFEYIYMDVDTMLALRADGHPHPKDCLHYCLPGPSDIGVQLLYNMLPFL